MKFVKKIEQLSGVIFFSPPALLYAILLILFTNCDNSNGTIGTNDGDSNLKIDAAISCIPNGLTVADITLYMQGGGNEFSKTIVNQVDRPKALPVGT